LHEQPALIMEAATRNAESPQPLPLFRAEALAARQKIQGEALFIRPFSPKFFVLLIASLASAVLVFLFMAHFEPRATVSGSLSLVPRRGGNSAQPVMEGVFYIRQRLALKVRPGSVIPVRCESSSSASFQPATVTRVESTEGPRHNASVPEPVISGTTYRITVAVSRLNSLPSGRARLQPGTKLEAEFPLERRPLIRWLIGAAAW
jgi:hypothetical protein